MEEEAQHLSDLQMEIESQLEKDIKKPKKIKKAIEEVEETKEADNFINQSTIGTIKNILVEEEVGGDANSQPMELGEGKWLPNLFLYFFNHTE